MWLMQGCQRNLPFRACPLCCQAPVLQASRRAGLPFAARSPPAGSPLQSHSLAARRSQWCSTAAASPGSSAPGKYGDAEPDPPRRVMALPMWVNTPGKVFCLAGLLKIMVVVWSAVPWAGVTTPAGLEAAATMIPFGLVLVFLARVIIERDLVGQWWLTPLLLASAVAFICAQQALFPPRRRVAAAPDPGIAVALAERRERAMKRLKELPTGQDADRMWSKYEQARAAQDAGKPGR